MVVDPTLEPGTSDGVVNPGRDDVTGDPDRVSTTGSSISISLPSFTSGESVAGTGDKCWKTGSGGAEIFGKGGSETSIGGGVRRGGVMRPEKRFPLETIGGVGRVGGGDPIM